MLVLYVQCRVHTRLFLFSYSTYIHRSMHCRYRAAALNSRASLSLPYITHVLVQYQLVQYWYVGRRSTRTLHMQRAAALYSQLGSGTVHKYVPLCSIAILSRVSTEAPHCIGGQSKFLAPSRGFVNIQAKMYCDNNLFYLKKLLKIYIPVLSITSKTYS